MTDEEMAARISRGLLLYEFHILPCLRVEWRNAVRIELCWLRWYIGLCFDSTQ